MGGPNMGGSMGGPNFGGPNVSSSLMGNPNTGPRIGGSNMDGPNFGGSSMASNNMNRPFMDRPNFSQASCPPWSTQEQRMTAPEQARFGGLPGPRPPQTRAFGDSSMGGPPRMQGAQEQGMGDGGEGVPSLMSLNVRHN